MNSAAAPKSTPVAAVAPAPVPAAPAGPPTWRLHEKTDEFTKEASSYLSLLSSNTFEFEFPYNGPPQHAVLFVVPHNDYNEVSLKVERGQFLCNRNNCLESFRFDDQFFDKWQGEPLNDDGSTNEITLGGKNSNWLNNTGCVYLELLHHKDLAVQVDFFREGARTFYFNIAGLSEFNLPAPSVKNAKECTNGRLKDLMKQRSPPM